MLFKKLFALTAIIASALIPSTALCGKAITVAVIDSGIPAPPVNYLCRAYSSKDYTGYGLQDNHGHGANISEIIDRYAFKAHYCQIHLKYWDPKIRDSISVVFNTIKAFKLAIKYKVKIINYSSSGTVGSELEFNVIKKATDLGIVVNVAAGNDGQFLSNENCHVFPACYALRNKKINVIGNLTESGNLANSSNYGNFVQYEVGTNVMGGGVTMSGTSQATATFTGKLIKKMSYRIK